MHAIGMLTVLVQFVGSLPEDSFVTESINSCQGHVLVSSNGLAWQLLASNQDTIPT